MAATSVTYNSQNDCFWRSDFTGKELDPETGYSYFGARYLDHTPLTLWLSVDPMVDKYPSISPYAYCAWNPVKLVDPDGKTIRVTDKQSQKNIIHSLSKAEAKYVLFDKNGNVDIKRLNKCKSNSTNFNALRTLANSKTAYIFSSEIHHKDRYNDIDFSDSDGTSKGEHVRGVTLIPENENDPSPDENVYIITSAKLSEEDQVLNIAHEGYGHAYFYELKKLGQDVNPNHDYQVTIVDYHWNDVVQRVIPVFGRSDENSSLKKQIEAAVDEAKQNYQSWTE